MTSSEMKRWLAKLGAEFGEQKGSHLKVSLHGRKTVLPMHPSKELATELSTRSRSSWVLSRFSRRNMRYPARFRRSDGAIVVTFPDIPEAITQGENPADARRHALDAFETALDFYFEEGRAIPSPSAAKPSHKSIELPPSVAAKILLHNEMVRQRVRPIELANRLGIPRQEVNRMLDWRHNTKIDTTAQALAALGKRLELHVT